MGFTAVPDGTLLSVETDGFKNDEERVAGEAGWTQILGWLQRYHARPAEARVGPAGLEPATRPL